MGCVYGTKKIGNGVYSNSGMFDCDPSNYLEDNIKDGNVDYVKDLCQQQIKGIGAADLDIYSAIKMAIKYNQLGLAEYILLTFNCQVDIDLVSLVVAKCKENCICSDGKSEESEEEVKPALASCKHYESAQVFFNHLRSEKRPMRFLTEPWAQFQAGDPFTLTSLRQTSQCGRLSGRVTEESLARSSCSFRGAWTKTGEGSMEFNRICSKGNNFACDNMMRKLDSERTKSKRTILQSLSRRPIMARAKTRSEVIKRIYGQSRTPFSFQEMELKEKDNTYFDISDAIGLKASLHEELGSYMSRVGVRQLYGTRKETSTTSFATNISELLLHPNVSNFDTNLSFTLDTLRTSKTPCIATESWTVIGHELPKSTKPSRIALTNNNSSHLSIPEKVAGSSSESESNISSQIEVKVTSTSNIINPSPSLLTSNFECAVDPPIFSSRYRRCQRLVSPMISEVSADEQVSGLQEKLFTAVFRGNLDLVCSLCNQGATDEEIADAFTIAKYKGFHEIADELMFGSVRFKRLTQHFKNISLEIGPPVSKICYDNWRIIAEMCISIAPPPPLSTRKAKVFFPPKSM